MNTLIHSITSDITSFIERQQELMFNERDFQMQLAVAMRESGRYDDVEVEYFIPNEVAADGGYEWASDLRLDIVVRKDGKYAVVELKYPTKRIESEIHRFGRLLKRRGKDGKEGDTLFEIVKNQGAQDLVSYNFWKDVRRVEIIKALFPESVVGGVAVMLTNDSYYTRGPKSGTICEAFSTADGRSGVHGTMDWTRHSAATKGNPGFTLNGSYSIKWHPSAIDGHKFYYTIITI